MSSLVSQITLLNELVSSTNLHPDEEKLRRVIVEMAHYAKYGPDIHDLIEQSASGLVDWISMAQEPTQVELELRDAVLKFLRKPVKGEKRNDEQENALRNTS